VNRLYSGQTNVIDSSSRAPCSHQERKRRGERGLQRPTELRSGLCEEGVAVREVGIEGGGYGQEASYLGGN